ncbi:MAG: DUF389 domain-containing protein [Candidatus Tantalella remota]|nr:DUF389 domain-containing protein [Candidatus Tantalella remota]
MILYGHLEETSVCDSDFIITMCLSIGIATFGLLLDNVAVIIGAMLVAPLMTPLIAAGLALVRGNMKLFRNSAKAMVFGTMAGLLIALLIGLLMPKDTITLQILARGKPNILDLFVALFGGMAAAYATARPKVVAALAGVAVAAALVPPLGTVGIAITEGQFVVARGAGILFITNIVAVVLGAATTYLAMGIRGAREQTASTLWLRRAGIGLVLSLVLLSAPLGYRFADQVREGQMRPSGYPLAPKLSRKIQARIAEEPWVDIAWAIRPSEEDLDVLIILMAQKPLRNQLRDDLEEIVNNARGRKVVTKVVVLQEGKWESTRDRKPWVSRNGTDQPET